MEQVGQFRIQLVRDNDFKPGNLALLDIARRQGAESVVAAQRVAIADYENLLHRIPFRQNNSLPGKRWLVLAGAS
jgi:hypothetical protein